MRQLADHLWWIDDIAPAAGVYAWRAAPDEADRSGDVILFDSGLPWHARPLLNALRRAGFAPGQVRAIVLTHADIDHVGAARALRQATGAAIVCHAVTAAILRDQLARLWGMGWIGRAGGFFARLLAGPLLRALPLEADHLLIDGAPVAGGFKAIYTPGHCAGHTAFYHPAAHVLIAGDACANRGGTLSPAPAIFTADRVTAAQSVARLARLDVHLLCCGHGAPIVADAQARLKELAERLTVPARRC